MNETQRFQSTKAFSLVEILVCIAIIAILAGLLFVVAGPARKSSLSTDETNRMRQIGLAAIIYQGDSEERVTGLAGLFRANPQIIPLAWSPLDPTREGYRYRVMSELRHKRPSYLDSLRISFTSIDDMFSDLPSMLPTKEKYIFGQPNEGWLLSQVQIKPAEPFGRRLPFGKYKRLLFDGNVVIRDLSPEPGAGGMWHAGFFSDVPEEIRRLYQE